MQAAIGQKTIWRHIMLLAACIGMVQFLSAQAKLSVQADETRVGPDQYVHLQYTLEKVQKLTRFQPPAFKGFVLVQGPEYTNGWTIQNGEMMAYVAIGFTLKPERKGKWTIPSATAVADGKTLRSASLVIEVTDEPITKGIDLAAGDQPLSDIILRKGETVDSKVRNNIFVKLDVGKRSVVVGEPVVASYKLYTRLNSASRVLKRPSFAGFSVIDMVEPESSEASIEKINGIAYSVYQLRKLQLYPLQEGKFILESMEVENTVSFIRESAARDVNSLNSILQALGENAMPADAWIKEIVTVKNSPITIDVLPLPAAGQPIGFSGAVGSFSLNGMVNADSLVTGEAYTYEVVLEGSGNIPVIGMPTISWSDAFENYEPELTEQLRKETSPIAGRRTYRIAFTPKKPGLHPLPQASFSYYDPADKQYHVLKTDSASVLVGPGYAGKSLRTVETNEKLNNGQLASNAVLKTGLIFGAAVMVLLIGFLAWRSHRQKKKIQSSLPPLDAFPTEDSAPVTQLSLFPAKHSLDKAETYLFSGDGEKFYQEIARVLRAVVAERFGVDPAQSNDLAQVENRSGMRDDLFVHVRKLMDTCQLALFAKAADQSTMEADHQEAVRLLQLLQEGTARSNRPEGN